MNSVRSHKSKPGNPDYFFFCVCVGSDSYVFKKPVFFEYVVGLHPPPHFQGVVWHRSVSKV